ncbi:hypothetical protein BU14_0196s0027 [Porphyra umbilicalis]|uniref:Uncharacterized protein n=1 Tax=Porphyra umbilicalis TaxID=2786 RepID=A0A1X6P6K2_PORUM|nr:hypothetical protein BU14_0196s0027 [Porphyra umbilicalis]|eukprot:OSX76360.1 hypothetical protein BU14_0196s0027 [Porphyra umbilicalis]
MATSVASPSAARASFFPTGIPAMPFFERRRPPPPPPPPDGGRPPLPARDAYRLRVGRGAAAAVLRPRVLVGVSVGCFAGVGHGWAVGMGRLTRVRPELALVTPGGAVFAHRGTLVGAYCGVGVGGGVATALMNGIGYVWTLRQLNPWAEDVGWGEVVQGGKAGGDNWAWGVWKALRGGGGGVLGVGAGGAAATAVGGGRPPPSAAVARRWWRIRVGPRAVGGGGGVKGGGGVVDSVVGPLFRVGGGC